MSKSLPYYMKDVHYDSAKFRLRSSFRVITQTLLTSNIKRDCITCSTGKFLVLLLIFGLAYLMLIQTSSVHSVPDGLVKGIKTDKEDTPLKDGGGRLGRLWRKPPRLPPRLSPDEKDNNNSFTL